MHVIFLTFNFEKIEYREFMQMIARFPDCLLVLALDCCCLFCCCCYFSFFFCIYMRVGVVIDDWCGNKFQNVVD